MNDYIAAFVHHSEPRGTQNLWYVRVRAENEDRALTDALALAVERNAPFDDATHIALTLITSMPPDVLAAMLALRGREQPAASVH